MHLRGLSAAAAFGQQAPVGIELFIRGDAAFIVFGG